MVRTVIGAKALDPRAVVVTPAARAAGCCLIALHLTACGVAGGDDANRPAQPVEQVPAPAPVAKASDTVSPGAPIRPPDATASRPGKAAPQGGAPAATPAAEARYELRLLRGSAAYRDPIRLQSLGSAGYPSLTAVAYRFASDGEPQPLKPAAACQSSIRCEHRGGAKAPGDAPSYLLTLDSPSFATLREGERGIEVAPTSKTFPMDVAVTVSLAIGDQPPIARRIVFTARP